MRLKIIFISVMCCFALFVAIIANQKPSDIDPLLLDNVEALATPEDGEIYMICASTIELPRSCVLVCPHCGRDWISYGTTLMAAHGYCDCGMFYYKQY